MTQLKLQSLLDKGYEWTEYEKQIIHKWSIGQGELYWCDLDDLINHLDHMIKYPAHYKNLLAEIDKHYIEWNPAYKDRCYTPINRIITFVNTHIHETDVSNELIMPFTDPDHNKFWLGNDAWYRGCRKHKSQPDFCGVCEYKDFTWSPEIRIDEYISLIQEWIKEKTSEGKLDIYNRMLQAGFYPEHGEYKGTLFYGAEYLYVGNPKANIVYVVDMRSGNICNKEKVKFRQLFNRVEPLYK